MDVLYLIIWLLVHLFTAFLCSYSLDSVEIWKDGKEISLTKPSVRDLESLDDKYKVNNYVEKVIKPLDRYFILRSKICDNTDKGLGCIVAFTVQGISLKCMTEQLCSIFLSLNYLPKGLNYFFAFVVSLIVCSIGCYIMWKIYRKKRCGLEDYRYSKEDLKNIFVYDKARYPLIDESTAFNNFAMNDHYFYLCSIETTVHFRYVVRKLLFVLGFVLLFIYCDLYR